ncbi:helix-turn-helix domain-containing protein [Labilibaculum euxinus]
MMSLRINIVLMIFKTVFLKCFKLEVIIICLKMGKIRSDLGIQIRQVRMSKKMTQSKLAELMGCNQEYISKIENGLVNTTVEYLIHIANVLEQDLNCNFIQKSDVY